MPCIRQSGCVNPRDRVFADRRTDARVRAVLDPARGEGGPEGWCRGRFRGTVTLASAGSATHAFAIVTAGFAAIAGLAALAVHGATRRAPVR
jgi:hypothetical protein